MFAQSVVLEATVTNRCRVWVRPLGVKRTKVKVSSVEDAVRLREAFHNLGMVCTEPKTHQNSMNSTFHVQHTNGSDHAKLMEIMEQVPEIELMFEPA